MENQSGYGWTVNNVDLSGNGLSEKETQSGAVWRQLVINIETTLK